jgi:serine/threonine-protein kinase RsbW
MIRTESVTFVEKDISSPQRAGGIDVRGQAVHLKVVGQLAQRDVALRTVSQACRVVLRTRRATNRRLLIHSVISAVGEAFNNIAVHGYRDTAPGLVEIDVVVDRRGRLAVEMRDYGRSFDPRKVTPPDLDALPESGMGIFIMNEVMDEVDYRPGRPNVLKLVKRLT